MKRFIVFGITLCLFACKSGKQTERAARVDAVEVAHRSIREEAWDFDSLLSEARLSFDSLELICMPEGIAILRAQKTEVAHRREEVGTHTHHVQQEDSTCTQYAMKKEEESRQTPPIQYRQEGRWKMLAFLIMAGIVFLYMRKQQ